MPATFFAGRHHSPPLPAAKLIAHSNMQRVCKIFVPRQPSPQSSGAPHGSIKMNNTAEQTLTNHMRFGRSFYAFLKKCININIQSLRAMSLRTRHPDLEVAAHRPRSARCTLKGVHEQEQRCWIIKHHKFTITSYKQRQAAIYIYILYLREYAWCQKWTSDACRRKVMAKPSSPRFGIHDHFLHRVVLNLTWAPGVIHKWYHCRSKCSPPNAQAPHVGEFQHHPLRCKWMKNCSSKQA